MKKVLDVRGFSEPKDNDFRRTKTAKPQQKGIIEGFYLEESQAIVKPYTASLKKRNREGLKSAATFKSKPSTCATFSKSKYSIIN